MRLFVSVLTGLLLVAACAGSDGPPPATRPASTPTASRAEDPLVTLKRAEQAMGALSSFHISMKTTISQGGAVQTTVQEVDQEGRTRGLARISAPGGLAFEMFIDLPAIYIRLPGRIWLTPKEAFGVSFEELGFDFSSLDVKSQFAIADVADKIESLADVQYEGETVRQIRTASTAEAYFREFASIIGGKGPIADLAKTVRGGSVEAIYLIDSQYRIRHMSLTMSYALAGSRLSGTSEATYSAFNVPVRFPADLPRP